MWEERTALRVGAIVTALVTIGVAVVLLVDFGGIGPAVRPRLYLAHPGPLREGADVQLAGRKIGIVKSIRLVSSREARNADHPLHPAGGVVAQLVLRRRYLDWVRENSEFFINSKGLIGESYVEIAPPPAEEELGPRVGDASNIRGIDPARMEHIIVTSFTNAQRFGRLLEELEPDMTILRSELAALDERINALEPSPGTFDRSIASVRRGLDEFDTLSATYTDNEATVLALVKRSTRLAGTLDNALSSLEADTERIQRNIDRLRNRLPGRLPQQLDHLLATSQHQLATLRQNLQQLQALAANIRTGQGTIGALLNDPEFLDDAKQLGRYIKRHPWKFLTRPLP